MHHVLLVGATGLIGQSVLRTVLHEARVERVYAPTRRALPPHPKLVNPVGDDLCVLLETLNEPVDTLLCCLGTTRQQAGSRQSFHFVDYALPLYSGQVAQRLGARQCVVVSALGAASRSLLFYSRVKGQMEAGLEAQGWPSLTVLRPAMLLGKRESPRRLEQITAPLFQFLPGRWRAIPAETVAQAMVQCVFQQDKPVLHIVESEQIASLANSISVADE